MLPLVKHMQISANLYFDDGFVVTISSPVFTKDIRHGDTFSDEQIEEFFQAGGESMAMMVQEKTASHFYKVAKAVAAESNMPGPKPSAN